MALESPTQLKILSNARSTIEQSDSLTHSTDHILQVSPLYLSSSSVPPKSCRHLTLPDVGKRQPQRHNFPHIRELKTNLLLMFDRRYLRVLLPSVSCSWNTPYYHITVTSQIRCRTRVNVEFGVKQRQAKQTSGRGAK